MNYAHFIYNHNQSIKRFAALRASALMLATLISLPLQSAPLEEQPETTLWTVQFAVLHTSNITSLESEAWSNSADDRQSILAELSALPAYQASADIQSQTDSRTPSQAQELLQILSPLTQSRRFGVLLASEWTQPSSQKKKKLPLYTDTATFDVYETVYGSISLEERNSLIAQVALTIVDTDTLNLVEQPLESALLSEDDTSLEPIDANQELSLPESQLDLAPAIQKDEIADKPTETENASPILFLKQQRQVQLNRVHYFDHPVTPGFLLVSKTTKEQQ